MPRSLKTKPPMVRESSLFLISQDTRHTDGIRLLTYSINVPLSADEITDLYRLGTRKFQPIR